MSRSTLAVNADAARRVFDIKCSELSWAVIDSGIDATHPAFRQRNKAGALFPDPFLDSDGQPGNGTRVKATYDFTQLQRLLDPDDPEIPALLKKRIDTAPDGAQLKELLDRHYANVQQGRALDWELIEPLIRIPHEQSFYYPPQHDHGTHVAGILAGDWRKSDPGSGLEDDLTGVSPDLRLFDLRVLDDRGRGDEFAVMCALQFVRHANARGGRSIAVHGVNLSLAIPHDVSNYACGWTPICIECDLVVSAGIVVVVAAGNLGYRRMVGPDGASIDIYNTISITDPGNADHVITVGATHRYRPHLYGVSYFSSRGPTADGRLKPDLVAPGEKITAPTPDASYGMKDGTSMAAPHVSGAAALLMARHSELVGRPLRVKEVLCAAATDLGRERYFQGAGMLDILRALQKV